jgi:hypothetical protein
MSTETPTTNAEKREFVGGLIASVLVKEGAPIIVDAVKKGLNKVASRPDTKTDEADVKTATPVVAKEVQKEMAEEMQARAEHKLDIEPHYSSRNLWASVVGIVTFIETARMAWTDGVEQTPTQWLAILGILVTALTPLYSRFIAKKPLWR